MTTLSAPLWGWALVLGVGLVGVTIVVAVLVALVYFVLLAMGWLIQEIEATDWSGLK